MARENILLNFIDATFVCIAQDAQRVLGFNEENQMKTAEEVKTENEVLKAQIEQQKLMNELHTHLADRKNKNKKKGWLDKLGSMFDKLADMGDNVNNNMKKQL